MYIEIGKIRRIYLTLQSWSPISMNLNKIFMHYTYIRTLLRNIQNSGICLS